MSKNTIIQSKHPVGSQWRRWDLHVHTPESKLGSSFTGVTWADYVDHLEKAAADNEIAVIGVTDYMSIDGYEKIHGEINDPINPRLQTVGLVLPNIELRAMPATLDGKALNIHILVDPYETDHIQKIKRALANLKIEYTSSDGIHSYGCVKDDLIRFAKAQNRDISCNDQAYKYGIEQFKPSYEKIIAWIKSEGWLLKNSLVGIANGKDGISGLPSDGFSAIRDELLKNCHFVFSANPNDRDYYLGKKQGTDPKKIKDMYATLKPCLHGSDAHDIKNLFNPDKKRFCWIKSDPTFEGLKQVLWEPESRVAIGEGKPQVSDKSKIIKTVSFENSNGWFTKDSIDMNPGLVCIIGEKGAGKTAVSDLIAFAAGVPLDLKSQSSFIVKGRIHLSSLKIKLTWGNNAITEGTLIDKPFISPKPLVRYLSQDFVERLCSTDHHGRELQEAIEEVVFSHLDEVNRENYSSFDGLRSAREASSKARQADYRGEIVSLNREIERLIVCIEQKEHKTAMLDQSDVQISEMKKQLPLITKPADEHILINLEKERENLKSVESLSSKKARSKRNLNDFLENYKNIKQKSDRQISDAVESSQLKFILSADEIKSLIPIWNHNIENRIEIKSKDIEDEISSLHGTMDSNDIKGNTLNNILLRIKTLQGSLQQDETNKNILIDLQRQITNQESISKKLKSEIEDINTKKSTLTQKERDRDEIYSKYFSSLSEDKHGLHQLYAPMKRQLEALGTDMKFELFAGYKIDVKIWTEAFLRFIDRRKPKSALKLDEIEKLIIERLSPAWASGNNKLILTEINNLIDLINPVEYMSMFAPPSMKLVDLLDWIYSTDHIGTTYKIKYEGTTLENLSPGTRGIALLVLYLLMDEDDRRPLIIDQPEGNLDNSSIYQQLVPYIRQAKQKRQIILVTHNPNLVVATDSEQVIVAQSTRSDSQSYPNINYISGSLEHNESLLHSTGIRQAVCTLLEGGDRAFKEREGRYSLINY